MKKEQKNIRENFIKDILNHLKTDNKIRQGLRAIKYLIDSYNKIEDIKSKKMLILDFYKLELKLLLALEYILNNITNDKWSTLDKLTLDSVLTERQNEIAKIPQDSLFVLNVQIPEKLKDLSLVLRTAQLNLDTRLKQISEAYKITGVEAVVTSTTIVLDDYQIIIDALTKAQISILTNINSYYEILKYRKIPNSVEELEKEKQIDENAANVCYKEQVELQEYIEKTTAKINGLTTLGIIILDNTTIQLPTNAFYNLKPLTNKQQKNPLQPIDPMTNIINNLLDLEKENQLNIINTIDNTTYDLTLTSETYNYVLTYKHRLLSLLHYIIIDIENQRWHDITENDIINEEMFNNIINDYTNKNVVKLGESLIPLYNILTNLLTTFMEMCENDIKNKTIFTKNTFELSYMKQEDEIVIHLFTPNEITKITEAITSNINILRQDLDDYNKQLPIALENTKYSKEKFLETCDELIYKYKVLKDFDALILEYYNALKKDNAK